MNNFYKILNSIDLNSVLEEYFKLEDQIEWTDYIVSKQAGLQYKDNENPWTSAVGKRQDDEFLYSTLNSVFQNTIFESIIDTYKLKRTRFMWVNEKTCYSMHRDCTPRIHIPIITNNQSFLVFKEGCVVHLHPGLVYWTDTRYEHTVINGSESPRLHLVGITKD
jgi:hypothetical protein